VKGIISFDITLVELIIMTIFGYVYNAVWDLLCGYLDVISLLVGDV